MSGDVIDGQLQQARQALQQKRPDDAITLASAVVAATQETTALYHAHWVLAQAQRMTGETQAEIDALHGILKLVDRDLPALLAMGDAFSRLPDERAASAWFQSALAVASRAQPPQQLVPLLQRAEQYCRNAQQHFTEFMESELAQNAALGDASAALQYGIDMLMGRRQLYLQQPSMFYYPGLPQRDFFERAEFDWVPTFEAQAEVLRDEFLALSAERDVFAPYVLRGRTRPAPRNHLLEDISWGAGYLWQEGEKTPLSDHVPNTMAALDSVPMPHIPTRSPLTLYSRLTPGTHIQPHHGLLNTRLICHLPLVAPDGCGLRVGAQTRHWRFGELLIFDDSFEHEAWNRGTSDRTVLLFEIWRPEIPEADRHALAHIFESINRVDPARGKEN